MERQNVSGKTLAVSLSGLAGYLDGIAFLKLKGFFVSFMSGNTTQMGACLFGDDCSSSVTAATIILVFVVGVIAGSLVSRAVSSRYQVAVLAMETLLLLLASVLQAYGVERLAIGAVILATGVENSTFQKDGTVTTGLTYMTGTLVKMGQKMAGALVGENPLQWLPSFLLWAGFVVGAAAGAAAYRSIGLQAIWGAAGYSAAATAIVAIGAWRRGNARDGRRPPIV